MLEIRWHGRGGQGAVTAAEILATGVINEGKYAQAFAAFGPERRGAPVLAFTRISDSEILTRCQIYEPDIIVILDKNLCTMEGVGDGLKKGGTVVLNTNQKAEDFLYMFKNAGKFATIDATEIALRELGTPITNTSILGALVRATGVVRLETLEEVMKQRFGQYAEKNISAVRSAFKETALFETGERE
ncbi:MAG: 2-oxoacid:acceptor oxidoreductase family protein [Candidatus Methanosuratus sp.]|nr:2-oxoacid:acceptor oxidoreductase family protein [Candidatus Methanosuratincola sp.]